MRLIDADALLSGFDVRKVVEYDEGGWGVDYNAVPVGAIEAAPTIDAVEVVRRKDCVYWKPRHIKLNDGSERAYFPGESYVDITVGINVGSQCMVDEYSGYGCDKSVFRRENDFCSRGKRKMDSEVHDDARDSV